MIIDWQHHASPEEIYKKRGGKAGQPYIKDGKVGMHLFEEAYQIDKHLEFMDAAGIDIAMLSTTLETVADCRITDEWYSKLMKDYPKRFVCFAPCLPTQGQEALDELQRAVKDLGLKGTVISPQNDGEPLDSRKLWPFYEKVSELKIPIFVHITNIPVGYDALNASYNLNVTMTREFDVAANTARLVLGGVLTEFPDIKIVMSHMGGGISSIFERIALFIGIWGDRFWNELGGKPPFDKPYKENFTKYFNEIYFDMAGLEGGMNGVKCALTTINPKRLLFATDYPYNFTNNPNATKQYIENIKKIGLSKDETTGILGGNAAQLLAL